MTPKWKRDGSDTTMTQLVLEGVAGSKIYQAFVTRAQEIERLDRWIIGHHELFSELTRQGQYKEAVRVALMVQDATAAVSKLRVAMILNR